MSKLTLISASTHGEQSLADLPTPFTPTDCDLRGMEWMPLHGHKLKGSDFDSLATDAEYRAAHRLWWVAWQQQLPAASLPDDDRIICSLAGFQRDPKGWAKVRKMALHGFEKCSDGRLYHRFLAPEAIIAWDKRLKERVRKAAYRAAKDGQSPRKNVDVPRDATGTECGQDADDDADSHVDNTGPDRTGPDNLSKKEEPPLIPPTDVEPVAKAPKNKSRCSLPENWIPNQDGLKLARDLRLPDETILRFTDYHLAKGTLNADWDAAWRTWCNSPYNKLAAGKISPAELNSRRIEALKAQLGFKPAMSENDRRIAECEAELMGLSMVPDSFTGPTIDGNCSPIGF